MGTANCTAQVVYSGKTGQILFGSVMGIDF